MNGVEQLKEGKSQEIDRLGNKCFDFHIPFNWMTSSHGKTDFGYDYWVYLKDNVSSSVETGFLVQLKTTTNGKVSYGEISVSLKGKNIRYYNNVPCPLMLVICDLSGVEDKPELGRLYYIWYSNVLLEPNQNNYTIKIPLSNRLSRELDINDEVEEFVSSYQAFVLMSNYDKINPPKKFEAKGHITERTFFLSTAHITLNAIIPTIEKIDSGSCLFTFALPGAEECMITFSHERILADLFSGSLNMTTSLKKGLWFLKSMMIRIGYLFNLETVDLCLKDLMCMSYLL